MSLWFDFGVDFLSLGESYHDIELDLGFQKRHRARLQIAPGTFFKSLSGFDWRVVYTYTRGRTKEGRRSWKDYSVYDELVMDHFNFLDQALFDCHKGRALQIIQEANFPDQLEM